MTKKHRRLYGVCSVNNQWPLQQNQEKQEVEPVKKETQDDKFRSGYDQIDWRK